MKPDCTDSPTSRKARGAFFTPPPLADFIARWAVRSGDDRVLEPSCGEAAFLRSTVDALRAVQGDSGRRLSGQIVGCDVHPDSVAAANAIMEDLGVDAALATADFFTLDEDRAGRFDAVVGNPPYVRYQAFSGEIRARALQSALKQGVRLTGLASSWAAFTVHATAFLKPGGRLGLVLPAELLSVNYAAEIRRFLLRRFGSVRLVLFERRIFPEVLEEVVLLLAEGSGSATHFEVLQVQDADDLPRVADRTWTSHAPRCDHKWMSAVVCADALAAYEAVMSGPRFGVLRDWGTSYLGAVTGNNRFFTLTRDELARRELAPSDLLHISPPGSRHLGGLSFTDEDWQRLEAQGARCYLFAPVGSPSAAGAGLIEDGRNEGVGATYKCRVRKPWWRVPLVAVPDLLFTYMNHDRPRLLRNDAGVHILNSVYGVRLDGPSWHLGLELLPIAFLNSVTLLGAELVGRSYGGGMLKHEPREVDAIPMPCAQLLESVFDELKSLQSRLAPLISGADTNRAVEQVDRIVLGVGAGMSEADIAAIRRARESLLARRLTRAGTQRREY